MENKAQGQAGQSIIIVAVAMVALVLFAALAVDISSAYVQRRTAQNAADGAALAGAAKLAYQINRRSYSDSEIKIHMNVFAERNGVADTDGVNSNVVNDNLEGYYLDGDGDRISEELIGSTTVPPDALGVEATAYITAPTFFLGLLGVDGLPLSAEAASVLQQACGAECVVPIATHIRPFTDTVEWDITVDCFNIWNGSGPGEFGWLNWSWQQEHCEEYPYTCPVPPEECHQDDCSAKCLGQNLNPAQCSSGFIAVGDWVAGTTGTVNDIKVRDWLEYYIGDPDDENKPPQPFTTVVWDYVHEGQQGCGPWPNGLHYRVAGFAEMQLLGYKLSEGQEYDPWIDPEKCIALGELPGEEPNTGRRLTARFLKWGGGETGNCYAIGTLLAPQLIR